MQSFRRIASPLLTSYHPNPLPWGNMPERNRGVPEQDSALSVPELPAGKEVSTNNCCKFMAIFIVFPGFCLKQLQQLFSDNS